MKEKYVERIFNRVKRGKIKALLALPYEPFQTTKVALYCKKYGTLVVEIDEPEEINIIDFEMKQDLHGISLDAKNKDLWPGQGDFLLYPIKSVEAQMKMEKWDRAYINDLPDAAFAYIEPDYKSGKSEDKSLRHLPHHDKSVKRGTENASVDIPHLRNALARVDQTDIPAAAKKKARKHLEAHAKVLLKNRSEENAAEIDELEVVMAEMDEFQEPPKTVVIKDEKIFRVGRWNGSEFSEKDLQIMIDSFEALKNSFLPAIKTGHYQGDEESMGYITALRTDGEYLFADIELDEGYYNEKIKTNRLRYKSIELWRDWDYNKKNYKIVLTALAFLGTSPPAVEGLGEIQKLSKEIEGREIVVFDMEREDKMEITLEQFNELKEKFEKQNEEFTALQEKLAKADQTIADLMSESRRKENEFFVEGLVKEGKLLPKDRDLVLALMEALQDGKSVLKFENEESVPALSLFKKYLEEQKAWTDAEVAEDLSVQSVPAEELKQPKDEVDEILVDGKKFVVDNIDIAGRAKQIVEEYQKRGIVITLGEAQILAEKELRK